MLGTCKVWKETFGFIHADDGGEYFCHFTQLENVGGYRKLDIGERVSFEVEQTARGQQAIDVRKLAV